jgi:DNA polymerase-3 subunit alpha
MEYIPAYADAKHGLRSISYLHSDLEPILKETYGVVTYQDQVLLIARKIAGFTWSEVDTLRKGMGKKQQDVIDAQRDKFVSQSVNRGYEEVTANEIWEQIAPFAGYGFNKAHAYCYGYIAFITAYLKANYPHEYMCTVITHESGNKPKMAASVQECHRMGIKVLPPSVNFSQVDFTVVNVDGDDVIAFGLGAVGGMGAAACRSIIRARGSKPFASVADFLARIDFGDINQRALTGMVRAGAFDEFGHRAQIDQFVVQSLAEAREEFRLRQQGQISLFSSEVTATFAPRLPDVPSWKRSELLSYEFESLGVYVSEHPLDDVRDQLRWYCNRNSQTIQTGEEGEIIVGGIISRIKTHVQKNGKTMAFLTISDYEGALRCFNVCRYLRPVFGSAARGNASSDPRRGPISQRRNEHCGQPMLCFLKRTHRFRGVEIAPADVHWRLLTQRISDRIHTLWRLYNTPEGAETSVLRAHLRKGRRRY